jgi:LPXTG-motif cell wall-anchored protein
MLALLLLPGVAWAADDDLAISIAYDKEFYSEGETVHATVIGTNTSGVVVEDASLVATIPNGFEAREATSATAQSLSTGDSLTLDLTLVRKSGTKLSGTSKKTDSSTKDRASAVAESTQTNLAQTGDGTSSIWLLAAGGLTVLVVGIVMARRGQKPGQTVVVIVAMAVLSSSLVVPQPQRAWAQSTKRESVQQQESLAMTYANVGVDLSATMTGIKVTPVNDDTSTSDPTPDSTPTSDPTPTPTPKPDQTPTPDPTPTPTPKKATIHVMHVNDTHGYYKRDKNNKAIGYSALKALKDKTDPDLLLDAGDTFHGQSFATVEQGESIAQLMDAVGVDATTPGNHDWSYGDDRLKELDQKHEFSILAGNVRAKDGSRYFKDDYVVKDVTSDEGTKVRIGVLGVSDESFYSMAAPVNVAHLQPFSNAAARATELATELRKEKGCDVVIALVHHNNPESLISKTSGLDAVVAGHQHIKIDRTSASDKGLVKDKDNHGVALVEADYYFHYIGTLDLVLNDTDGNGTWDGVDTKESMVDYNKAVADNLANSDIDKLVKDIEDRETETLSQRVGSSSRDYDYPFRKTDVENLADLKLSWEWLRTRDEPIGHVVTAAYLDLTGADLSLENAGGIRGGIPSGDVTYQDVLSISPYGNTLETRKLTGKQLRTILEHSLDIMAANRDAYEQQEAYVLQQIDAGTSMQEALEGAASTYAWPWNSGNVLILGGATLTVDWSKPTGSRITGCSLVKGGALDDATTYTVAVNSYVPTGSSDDYPDLAKAAVDKEWGTCENALRTFVAKEGWEDSVTTLTGTLSGLSVTSEEVVEPVQEEVVGE